MEPLTNIPKNSLVFVDSNIFIYHFCFSPDSDISARCTEFFLRSLRDGIKMFTSTSIVAEVLHRAMLYEATEKFAIDPKGALGKLQKNPELAKKLTQYHGIPTKILEFGVNSRLPRLETKYLKTVVVFTKRTSPIPQRSPPASESIRTHPSSLHTQRSCRRYYFSPIHLSAEHNRAGLARRTLAP